MCIFVDDTYTLTQEGDGTLDVEVNNLSVDQNLDQSPEEPKAVANIEEGKHWNAYNLFGINSHLLLFSIYVLFCAFKFQELF
jgi:hypothetical protein